MVSSSLEFKVKPQPIMIPLFQGQSYQSLSPLSPIQSVQKPVQKPVNIQLVRPIPIKPIKYTPTEVLLDEEICFQEACNELYQIVRSNKSMYF
jgi:hypothetical protein